MREDCLADVNLVWDTLGFIPSLKGLSCQNFMATLSILCHFRHSSILTIRRFLFPHPPEPLTLPILAKCSHVCIYHFWMFRAYRTPICICLVRKQGKLSQVNQQH